MRVVAKYSLKRGSDFVERTFPRLLGEVVTTIASVNAEEHKTKESEEATMPGQMLYSPPSLNAALKQEFNALGWKTHRVRCEYSTEFYEPGYNPKPLRKGAFREMDYVKDKLGLEVQFGKYAFMVYNVCAKMTIFQKKGIIDAGVEVVPVKSFVDEMSSGVSYFEQMVWDMVHRGVADIDIPVLILGIDRDMPSASGIPPQASRRMRRGAKPGPKRKAKSK